MINYSDSDTKNIVLYETFKSTKLLIKVQKGTVLFLREKYINTTEAFYTSFRSQGKISLI
jgi:hypothetical protein